MSAQQSSVGDHRVYEDGDQVKTTMQNAKAPKIAKP